MDATAPRSLTPGLPEYPVARHFLRIINGVSYTLYRNLYNSIWEQRGNPQETVDWSVPEIWILERLEGDEQNLALRLWRESKGTINPRYLRGPWYLCARHHLLIRDQEDILSITPEGEQFLNAHDGPVVAGIDSYEGILTILRLVGERGPGRRSEFLPDFSAFCRTHTNYRSESPIKGALYDRLINLIDRGFVNRSGQIYEISDAGLNYLNQYANLIPGKPELRSGKPSELRKLAKDIRGEARQQLADFLMTMNPFKFEELIKFLLEEMGYTGVETTSPTNDKGVDVVANIELGISSVREVVQVKRHKGNINRRVLDQLRGSLHRFNAVRGTIITTGGFSKGTAEAAFERGAAPITLIDGDKLLDLLIQNGIGVSRQTVEYFEFDATSLADFDTKEIDKLDGETAVC
jgi:restriction system protein